MLIDVSPLRHSNYRHTFLGQLISALGSSLTYVALPYQMYQLTKSSLAVGLIGVVQLVPLLFTAFVGGTFADRFNRRHLVMISELLLALTAFGLAWNTFSDSPRVWLVYALAAIASAVNGFQGPAITALVPSLLSADEIQKISSLESFKSTFSYVVGPAIAGLIIAQFGVSSVFFVDGASFLFSILMLSFVRSTNHTLAEVTPVEQPKIFDGLKYAWSRQELLGTYAVDFIAVVFGIPTALFPAVAEKLGGAEAVGLLYSAPAVGAFLLSVFSGWTNKVNRQGVLITLAAIAWGIAIIGFGLSAQIGWAVFFLVLAGAADAISAIFRNMIWNMTIPTNMRGRMAGVEMVGYMSGPLLGNAESGLAAALLGVQGSILTGGGLCVLGVALTAIGLKKFWKFDIKQYQSGQLESPPHTPI